MATLLMRATDGASADKKRRARKGKNAQKKQPQRGLGVAQLEKLRLQEQSLLCPTSSYSLRLCTPPEHSMSRCDGEVAQTVLSLTNGQAAASSLRDSGVSRLALSGHSSSQSLSTQGKCNAHNTHDHAAVDAKRVASRALACINQSSKFSAANVPFFSSVLATAPLQVYDAQGQGLDDDDRRVGQGLGEHSTSNNASTTTTNNNNTNAPVYIFSAIHNLKGAATPVNDSAGYKLHPVFKDVSRIPITITEPTHYLESLLGSDVPHIPRKRIELPVVGVTPNVDKPKELPSFQSHPSIEAWTSPDKESGRKRPWLAIQQEKGRQASHAQALDLNAPAGESEMGHSDRHCAFGSPDMLSDNRGGAGAHYTTGIVRSALGNSCLPLVKLKSCSSVSPWHDSESPSSASGYFPDLGSYPENGLLFKQSCPSPSMAKDSCSSATGPTSYLTLNRKRCLNDPESPSPMGKESICSSNFLTLGMSSSFHLAEGWHEPEGSTQDTLMSMSADGSRLKQSSSSGCDADDGSPLQLRTPLSVKQESGAVDLEKHKSLRTGCAVESENVLPLGSPPSNNFSGNRPLKSARIRDEDILDLRLKLAL
ncbi:hypothetical protein MPTK2_1g12830 [Marchantia polymorpha subsp. ruderalis]